MNGQHHRDARARRRIQGAMKHTGHRLAAMARDLASLSVRNTAAELRLAMADMLSSPAQPTTMNGVRRVINIFMSLFHEPICFHTPDEKKISRARHFMKPYGHRLATG